MRSRSLVATLVASLALPAVAEDAMAQFNPRGRQPTTQPARPTRPARPSRPARPTRPTRPKKSEEARRNALIARYTGIVLQRPGEQFPLQRLTELYRERDGKLDALVAEFEKRAAQSGSDQWNAVVALAGIYRHDGKSAHAIETYEKAIAERPKEPAALTALAHLLKDRGDLSGAKQRFEQALPHLTAAADVEQTLRTLMALALDLKAFDDAKQYHERLVKRAKGSFFVRAELGRELLLRGEYARAETEYRDVVKAATGDNRVLAPALRDLGRAKAKLGKSKEALQTLKRALRVAGAQSGVRREIYDIIVEVYREGDDLRELIALLEKEGAHDFERLRLLGSLYEETGQIDKALVTYRAALAKNRRDISTRIKVVQLLQIQGGLDEAIREYEALIRAAPRNPDFVFQLAEALIQRGDRDAALAHLRRLEARSARDEDVQAALVDFYERIEEKDRAMALLQKLSKGGTRDPRHLVELGDRYFQDGDKEQALRVWERIKVVVPNRARAMHTLGEVYLEHDMPTEALQALKKAVELAPTRVEYKKAYAIALERTGTQSGSASVKRQQYEEAQRIWEQILRDAGDDRHVAREARTHIVTLWSLGGSLAQRVRPLERRLEAQQPDLEAGRLLAEVHLRLRSYRNAERVLRLIVGRAPGDAASLLRLERVLVLQRKLGEAITVLEKLVQVEPRRAREYYQRMAQYAAELYEDDDAIRYAARAVELSPDDAMGHKKLGEMYRRRQDTDAAIREFRKAISKNDRLFTVYFQLAELLLSQGKHDEADRLLRRVMRASPDEELVAQAARLSMQVNLGKGTLESLEKELLPVALGNPQKPIYRRLLVEIYGALAFPLAHQAKSADPERADAARSALRRIGERAVKPLLDALNDDRPTQQRIAIELLGYIQNQSAGPALYAYATGKAESALRVRAMIAVGVLRDPDMLPKLTELIAPRGAARADESNPVAVAAAWAVARMQSPKARGLLLDMLRGDAPSIRALGALGLGLVDSKRDAAVLTETAASFEAGPLPRAAAAFALGQLGVKQSTDVLTQLSEATDSTVRGTALLALARLDAEAAPRAIAEALVTPSRTLRAAATSAALVLETGELRMAGETLGVPEGRVDVRTLLERLRPDGYTPDEHARALVRVAPALARSSVAASQSSPERARAVADALLARGGRPAFGPLTEQLDQATDEARGAAERAANAIAKAVVPPFVALASHPSPAVRATAVQLLATRAEPSAREAALEALSDRDAEVRRAALAAISRARMEGAVGAVVRLLDAKEDWPVRVRAAEALGTLAASGDSTARAVEALARAAKRDPYALVRQAAARALFGIDPTAARPVLTEVAREDVEPRVRETAKALLAGRQPAAEAP